MQVLTICDRFRQEKKYFRGIASEDGLRLTQRVTEGVFGKTSLQQIQEIYRDCCRLSGPEDEVWLFGFSRGAYVVRAVAGLLHYMRALTSADKSDKAFEKDYKEALKVYRTMQRQDRLRHGPGQVSVAPLQYVIWRRGAFPDDWIDS